MEHEARELEPVTDSWIDQLLSGIEAEIVAGRTYPLPHPDPRVQIFVTENALLSHLRTVSDQLDDVILGKCDIDGDFSKPNAPVIVNSTASVASGANIHSATEQLRRIIASTVQKHTGHSEVIVNITVTDIHVLRAP